MFLEPFLCNLMQPKTSDNDFSKNRPKSNILNDHVGYSNNYTILNTEFLTKYKK